MFEQTFLGNTTKDYLLFLAYFALGLVFATVLRKIILRQMKRWAERTATTVDDFVIQAFERSVVPLIYFAVFYVSIQTLSLHQSVATTIEKVWVILLTFLLIRFIVTVLEYTIRQWLFRKQSDEARERSLKSILPAVKVVIWGVGLVFLLDNLGFEISAVVAGLGIGGIAVALAAQAVLGDLFSYFAILFDRPFEVGDFIIVGEQMGTVEYVGIKTTRVRSLSGEQLIFCNTDLTGARVRNFKRMEQRRVVFQVGVTYGTPRATMEVLPGVVRGIIAETSGTRVDRVHFARFGDFSLIVEAVYFVLSSEYSAYMDVQQKINLRIMEEFEKRGVEFAFPTQTVHVHAHNVSAN